MTFCNWALAADPIAPGTRATYAVISATDGVAPPFASAEITWGPEESSGNQKHFWWELAIQKQDKQGEPPLCIVRGLTTQPLLSDARQPVEFQRYLLQIPQTQEALEYQNIHSGKALIPNWKDFQADFVPLAVRYDSNTEFPPQSASFLGHTLSLRRVDHNVQWQQWTGIKELKLDPELLVGTGRNFKDQEGHRLVAPGLDYHYVPFTRHDYRAMIDAGMNLFTVSEEQAAWIRDEPVFFVQPAAPQFPADLYRSNYLGNAEFTDEPWSRITADRQARQQVRSFSDAINLLQQRVRVEYDALAPGGSASLDHLLRGAGANLGDMHLARDDVPIWETHYATAYHQLSAGGEGLIHEGRYQLPEFDSQVAHWIGQPRKHTPQQMLRFCYAILRGSARQTSKQWGTSIYGQCDAAISPQALALAYDMDARYLWFWTSDHGHHVPWVEQIALARSLKEHAAAHPRASTDAPADKFGMAIVIPADFFPELKEPWWLSARPSDDPQRQRYARLMRELLEAVDAATQRNEDFDVVFDDGSQFGRYGSVGRLGR